jgi:hypothetical protein
MILGLYFPKVCVFSVDWISKMASALIISTSAVDFSNDKNVKKNDNIEGATYTNFCDLMNKQ